MVELVWEPHGVVRRLSGVVGMQELDESAKQLQGNARTDDLRYIIHDFSACTDVVVPQSYLEFMAIRASFALQRNSGVKIAFVGNHPSVHALMDAFNNHGISQHRCHRFDTLAEARQFTGNGTK